MKKTVPTAVAGIVFLSGGQSPDQATENLRMINQLRTVDMPMSFSFGRALQQEALSIWQGSEANKQKAQAVFLSRVRKVFATITTRGPLANAFVTAYQ